jgi:NTP pyrophosphatase (non-canonical NTP hydrolase)
MIIWEDAGLGRDDLIPVYEEDDRQRAKWGFQKHTPEEWLMYLTEEVGELAKAISENKYRGGPRVDIRDEAIEVATLALKIASMAVKP